MEDVTAAEIEQMIYDLGGLGVTFHDPDEMDGSTIGRVARTPNGRVQVIYDLERMKTPGELRQVLTLAHRVVRGEVEVPPGRVANLEATA